jgi:hypothetical protein
MRYLSGYEATFGEIRQGPDGSMYQFVQGVDGLGNPIGIWRRLRKLGKRLVRHAMPFAQRIAPFIPGGAAALTAATPILRQAGIAGLGGMGYLGELRQGPGGDVYQLVQGFDGLGNPVGIWKRLRRLGRRAFRVASQVAPLIPGGAAALTAITPIAQQAGVARSPGLGALYAADDGSVYQVEGLAEEELQGFAAAEELQGFAADDEELQGLDADEELQGFAADEELQGFAADEELQGFADEELQGLAAEEELQGLSAEEELSGLAQDEELQGMAADEELQGLDQGYVREAGVSGLEAYVPEAPPATRWFAAPALSPDMWKPLW